MCEQIKILVLKPQYTLSPRLCLLGDRSQTHNISSGEFSVIMAGTTTAARTILRLWKTPKPPELKEWVNSMIKTASYELMLNRMNNRNKNKASIWDLFWIHITLPDEIAI